MHDNLLQVRSCGVNFHVLRDKAGLYLIDGGFVGGRLFLKRALEKAGWSHLPIIGIIATHGHLDHILHIKRISQESGAWIAAPRLDASHYHGQPGYSGASKVTGWLEAVGRPLFGFGPFTPDRLLDEGDTLDIWHGLTVIHLPGHTSGHSGLYCERLKLLFCADLFASYRGISHFPPAIFNIDSDQIPAGASKALRLDLEGVYPNHADRAKPDVHLHRLRKLTRKRAP